MFHSLVCFVSLIALGTLALFLFLYNDRIIPTFKYPIVFTSIIHNEAHVASVSDHVFSNVGIINAHNANPNKKFFMKFSDISALSPAQYQRLLGFRMAPVNKNVELCKKSANFIAPDAINWIEEGVVNHVKNQGLYCGSCWAFAAIGALESQHAIRNGTILELSEQQLVDCSHNGGNEGCHGGIMSAAYDYIKGAGGEDTDQAYPYVAHEQTCHFRADAIGERLQSYAMVKRNDEQALKDCVAEKGPVAVAIDAHHASFQNYGGGVYYEPACSSTNLTHAVLVVGYGKDPTGGDYWLIKNSWGTTWGEEGYMKMARNKNNHCGIAAVGTIPVI